MTAQATGPGVLVRLPPALRGPLDADDPVPAVGDTLAEAFADLARRFDGLGDRLLDGSGLRRGLNVYVRGRDVRFGAGLSTPLAAGDVVVVLAVGGPPATAAG